MPHVKNYLSNPFIVMGAIMGFFLVIGMLLFWMVWLFRPELAQSSTFLGGTARMATSSAFTFDGGVRAAEQIIATSSCSSRVITTKTSPITLTFADGMGTASERFGHLQAASTTAAYDAERYGCGRITAYPFDVGAEQTTITITNVD